MTTRCGGKLGARPARRSTPVRGSGSQRAGRSRSPTSWRSANWRRISSTDFRKACRGYSRSVPMGAVVSQVRALVERGHAEIVLTGVDLTSYGADLPGAPKLGTLTKQILRHVPELKRLRISSIDQVEVDRDLLDVIADDERLMPHLHLSLQSGDDLILKRMKRRHSRAQAIDFCAQVRRLRPDITLGADIIAGFPTETGEMFTRSLDLVEECNLTFLHVFPYSPRPGTPAARMPQVSRERIKD